MIKKLNLDYVEFYITNICNFNCLGCNRFNNYSLSGIQKWKDYQPLYQKWAELVDIKSFRILGGEPMCNPTYLQWIKGLTTLWPEAESAFITNGYYIKKTDTELYQALKETKTKLHIGLHNKNRLNEILDTIKNWLQGNIRSSRVPKNILELPGININWKKSYESVRDPSWPDCDKIDDWQYLPYAIQQECKTIFGLSPELISDSRRGYYLYDDNHVEVLIEYENFFHQGHIVFNETKKSFQIPISNPEISHDVCDMKFCHHFSHGKLYKCGVVTVLPEFENQYQIELDVDDRLLLQSYRPADPNWSPIELEKFINELKNPIPQCKFCPEQYDNIEIFAETNNKPKIQKKNGN